MRSPFKLLDAYTLKDRDVFFGRTEEVATLYDLVNKNRLILVYGESGTGKTSLVQCGLAGRFDITDWYPIFIRRRDNINSSMIHALKKAVNDDEIDDLVEMLEEIYANYLRPVYLIFDQLEELLILGGAEERSRFIAAISRIYQANLPCRILFILRKEYLANLYDFEKAIPALFDRRLMVESMSYAKVEEVIAKSCERFNISLEQPEVNTRQIVDNISAGKSGIPLPYLQVYLDMLYREDFARAYPQPPAQDLPPLTFTTAEIEAFGEIDDVLQKFLREQETDLQSALQLRYPQVGANTISQILDAFVSEEGTKRVLAYQLDSEIIQLEAGAPDYLVALTPPVRTYCLQELEKRRILRVTEQTYELAHDSLAALIDRGRSDEQRLLNEIKNRIKNGVLEFERSNTHFSEKQLLSVEEALPKLSLSPQQKQFIVDSWAHVKSEKDRQLKAERSKRRLATAFAVIGFTLFAIACIAIIWGYQARQATQQALVTAQEAKAEAETERDNAKAAKQEAEQERDKAQQLLEKFQQAEADKVWQYVNGTILRSAAEMQRKGYQSQYQSLLNEARNELKKYPDNPILKEKLNDLQ